MLEENTGTNTPEVDVDEDVAATVLVAGGTTTTTEDDESVGGMLGTAVKDEELVGSGIDSDDDFTVCDSIPDVATGQADVSG